MRILPPLLRAGIESPYGSDPLLCFVTLTHADFGALRFVADVVDYVLDGETYTGFPFEVVFLSDGAEAPTGRISVQNVDRAIGEAVRGLSSPPGVVLDVYAASDFDLTVVPRVPLGTPQLIVRASNLYFRQVRVDVMTASGQLTSWDYANQPWPSRYATQGILPGVFR